MTASTKPRPQAPRIGIRDVAQRAGVSIGSASRVINGVTNVAPELRERVRAAVGELGYRPNHAARSLRMQATRTIGFLLTDVTQPLQGRLYQAVEERLRRAGYVVLLANSLGHAEREVEILHTFALRGVDGVIAAPCSDGEPLLQALREIEVPLLLLERDVAPERDRVCHDHAAGLRAVAMHLAGLGHRRLALVVDAEAHESAPRPLLAECVAGFRSGLQAAGLQPDDALIVELCGAAGGACRAVSLLLRREPRLTALAVPGTGALADALHAIAIQGLRVPHDVSLVSIGDSLFARSHAPPLTALDIDTEHTAEQAVSMLLQRVRRDEAGAGRLAQLLPRLIERASCAPPAAAPARPVDSEALLLV